MRKWRRRALWSGAALVLLMIAGRIALQWIVSEAWLKSIAQEKVQQTWGRQLRVNSLSWSMFPYPQLHGSGIAVSNAAWAQDKYLLEADDIKARLAFMPLLTGEVVIKRLDVNGLKANLEATADGKRNWDLPIHDRDATSTQRLAQTLQQIDLTALRVNDTSIVYREAKNPSVEWQVSNLKADGDRGLRNISFYLNAEREGHPLQVSGKLDDLSNLGESGAQTKGSISAKSGEAALMIEGTLPLTLDPRHFDVSATIDAASMKEVFGFFNIKRGVPAALTTSASLQGDDAGIQVKNFKLQLGKLNASGDLQWNRSGSKPVFTARMQADRIDMIQTLLDAGQPPLPPKQERELFRDNPLPWPLLAQLNGTQGKLDLQIGLLKLRSGIDVSDAAAMASFDGDRMTVNTFSGKLLGGSASGDAVFSAGQKSVQLNLNLNGTQLGRWLKETGKNIDMVGGSMQVDARITTSGDSMKALAAAATGPVNVRIGSGKILSPKAGNAELWLTGLFSAKNAEQVDLACASMRLPFKSGIAKGDGIAGARSDASQLLTSGVVDLRQQDVDLRGRVRARSGVSLGISTFAGNVKIVGKIAKPQLNLDESGIGGAIARIGAAIFTSGISIIATSIWDGANPESDPCQVVFSDRLKAAGAAPKR